MQKNVSTNIQLPFEVWKAVKIKAAEEGKKIRELVLEGLLLVLNKKKSNPSSFNKDTVRELFLRYAGSVSSGVTDGSVNHDKYIYDDDK